ncbi:hypothetical protein E2C01_062701 [Portunus trituberculatus]|uniref:Uncharacterized protein n=1 Tax=Portunus trituberculatus TaxID=210409 RepID=A0A5B7HI22_PORTR|nr:hypothetical protein [Portunus trituberculatus]
MRPSEALPDQETTVRGTCGGEYSSLLRPEDDVSRARGKGDHLLGLQWERALAGVDGVPRPHADQSF